jgi:hypothetical protein
MLNVPDTKAACGVNEVMMITDDVVGRASLNERVCVVRCAWSGISRLKSERIKLNPRVIIPKKMDINHKRGNDVIRVMIAGQWCLMSAARRAHTDVQLHRATAIKSPTLSGPRLSRFIKRKRSRALISRGVTIVIYEHYARCNQSMYHEPEASISALY